MGLSKTHAVTLAVAIVVLAMPNASIAQDTDNAHRLTGTVYDDVDSLPIPNAIVHIKSLDLRDETNDLGQFVFDSLQPGANRIMASRVGYDSTTQSVQIPATRPISIYLHRNPASAPDVVVVGDRIATINERGPGRIVLDTEHLRHTPGSLDDVSRAVSRLPSVTPLYDVLNIYSVRGGSPNENGYTLDGIVLPDINHLPNQGGTGGAVGLINLDLLQATRLQTGAFDAAYGGYLSSVLDMEWRSPRRDRLHGEIDLGVAGANLNVEGPVGSHAGYMLSIRHSYLDELLDDTDLPITPRFDDVQGRVDVDVNPGQRLSLVGVLGIDNFDISREEAIEEANGAYYGEWDAIPHMIGLNLESVWSPHLVSRTSVAHSGTSYDYVFENIATAQPTYINKSTESSLALRHDLRWTINETRSLSTGLGLCLVSTDIYNQYTYVIGRYEQLHPVDTLIAEDRTDALPTAYASYNTELLPGVSTTAGIHLRYFARTGRFYVEPRARAEWAPWSWLQFTAAGGITHQPMPYNLMAQSDSYRHLKECRAIQASVGSTVDIGAIVAFRVELYRKWYDHMPMDPYVPTIYVLDEILSRDSFRYELHQDLQATGRAISEGIEFMLERNVDFGLYGSIGVSLSDARYKGLNHVWYERALDVEHAESVDLGYRSHNGWILTLSWRNVGGLKYTRYSPHSYQYNQGVLFWQMPNTEQLPRMHWMDVRVEKQFSIGAGDLSVYAGVWNVYDADAISSYVWSTDYRGIVYDPQLDRVPVFGIIYRR